MSTKWVFYVDQMVPSLYHWTTKQKLHKCSDHQNIRPAMVAGRLLHLAADLKIAGLIPAGAAHFHWRENTKTCVVCLLCS